MDDVADSLEAALSLARDRLRESDSSGGEAALSACRSALTLYRPPAYDTFNAAALFRERLLFAESEHRFAVLDPVQDTIGDPDPILECVSILMRGADLDAESDLVLELVQDNGVPLAALSLEGPGRFPDPIRVGGYVPITLEELGARWTLATRGGRIDHGRNGLLLRLSGQRMPPQSSDALEPLRAAVQTALADLACESVDHALALLDGDATTSPADLTASIAEASRRAAWTSAGGSARQRQSATMDEVKRKASNEDADAPAHSCGAHPPIEIELLSASDASIPPLAIRRGPLERAFRHLFRFAKSVLPRGGAVAVLPDYDRAQRTCALAFSIAGTQPQEGDPCLAASMRRAVEVLHEGRFSIERGAKEVLVTFALPDRIGKRLDAWIPGFERFSDRSKQVLRLIRGAPQPEPLEAALLPAVLEEELERWLLPRLSEAPTINLAHAMTPDNRGLGGGSPERLRKVFEQIRRGKPRKEIARPAHAAELLYACRQDQRSRAAVGAEGLTQTDIETLCRLLLSPPIDAAACLRILASR